MAERNVLQDQLQQETDNNAELEEVKNRLQLKVRLGSKKPIIGYTWDGISATKLLKFALIEKRTRGDGQ